MIKPRSQPSYFSWKLKAKNGMQQELFHHVLTIPSPQNSQNRSYQLCQWAVWFPQPLTSKAMPLGKVNIPVSFTGEVQPSIISSGPAILPSSPRHSTHSTKGIPPARFTPTKKWTFCVHWNIMEANGKALSFHIVFRTYIDFASIAMDLWSKEHCGIFLTFSISSHLHFI